MISAWVVAAAAVTLWVGATLALSELRWFARRPLDERLRPYVPGGFAHNGRAGVLSVASFHEVVGPLSRTVGARLERLLGVAEPLEVRLERIHSPMDVTAFRVRQIGWSLVAFAVGALLAAGLRAPLLAAGFLVVGGPLFAFLVIQQQVAHAAARWQRRVFLELPVVAEQLAMLLSSGYSLTGALTRIAERGQGACARDIARVNARIRQGLSDVEALREWAVVVRVDAVDRLVPVLALHRETSDLGRLIAEEARAIRRDVQRELIEIIERRGQQIWIPVTVATLLPGVIFLTVPFIQALATFTQ